MTTIDELIRLDRLVAQAERFHRRGEWRNALNPSTPRWERIYKRSYVRIERRRSAYERALGLDAQEVTL